MIYHYLSEIFQSGGDTSRIIIKSSCLPTQFININTNMSTTISSRSSLKLVSFSEMMDKVQMLVTPAIPFTVRLYRRFPPVATYAISGPARFLMIRFRSILMRQELEDIFDFSSKGGQCPSGAAKDSIISRSGATLAQMFCYLGRLLIGPEATTVASPATAEILVVYVQSCGIMKINRIRMVAFLVSNIFRAIFVICFHPLMQSIGSHLRRAAWHSLHRLSSPEHTSFTQHNSLFS